jgi:hypothetical protein
MIGGRRIVTPATLSLSVYWSPLTVEWSPYWIENVMFKSVAVELAFGS